MSQLTTHVLDTAIGKPAPHLHIQLQGCLSKRQWRTLAQGCTNHDGRIPDLLPPSMFLAAGDYKMIFDTATYFAQSGTPNFYPRVEIIFHIADHEHYHVPLLLNPFGYSTYRGS
ncbi:MAG: hydroxyisourate hydrolase [Sphingobacteriales bacterium]|nr:hydroxyisourate hydrolase [Sphingobacteriales bacterium]